MIASCQPIWLGNTVAPCCMQHSRNVQEEQWSAKCQRAYFNQQGQTHIATLLGRVPCNQPGAKCWITPTGRGFCKVAVGRQNVASPQCIGGGYLGVLEDVAQGKIAPADAAMLLEATVLPNSQSDDQQELAVDGYARLDTGRIARTGFPEVVWGPGKTPEQIAGIMAALATRQEVAMATRITSDVHEKVEALLPGSVYHRLARILTYSATPTRGSETEESQDPCKQARILGQIAILSAGTSDLPVAEEARITAEVMGCSVVQLADVGVAGLHRLLKQLPTVRSADVVLVVAGMDGALPSVVAGLVDAPVIAVPTSIGYGAAFQGVAPLLGALNACAPGVVVVNIDNGFGAAMAAARILRAAQKLHGGRAS